MSDAGASPTEHVLDLPGGGALRLGRRTVVMGILNVTPDSFSDGGMNLDPDRAVRRGLAMVAAGAEILDVGGESTRPGADPVPPEEERRRILPVIERLVRETEVPISVDTRRGATARAALAAGATIVNDVSALDDPETGAAAAEAGAALVLMHMRGTPADMRERCDYDDVAREVTEELRGRVRRAVAAGVPESQIVVDPGIGFAKRAPQSFELIRRLGELRALGLPILVGPSRKSFLREVRDVPPEERLALTIGAVLAAVANGADVVRVHDVGPVVDAVRAFEAAR